MAERNIGKRYGGPWFNDYKERLIFEHGVTSCCPGMSTRIFKQRSVMKIEYSVSVNVPHYSLKRKVSIAFSSSKDSFPVIKSDGPTESPHRYQDGSLCVWYPWDRRENRWIFDDGLLHLLALIQIHLFKEEWWRASDPPEWLGPEAPHDAVLESPE